MIKIAICDDENAQCSLLENILIDILSSKEISYDIDVFYSGENLLENLEANNYNLIFLDIELPKADGIHIGDYIRNHLKNEIVQIAYISAKKQYALELFDYRPINFLIKPLDKAKVSKVIDKYFCISNHEKIMFSYKIRQQIFNVPLSDILYFESFNRKIRLHKKDQTIDFYDNLANIYNQVKQHNFIFIHQSYIINFAYIKKLEYKNVTMTNNDVLPISQSNRSDVRLKYNQIRKGQR